jgi:hypothetical protein
MNPPGTPPGENEIWTPPRLRARLAAQKGLAPAPTCYVVWRATTRAGVAESRGYELPGEPARRDEAAFERWLLERNLAGAERLSVSVLVIREQLDAAGLLREAVLERRRGGVDGPYYGNVARVEFNGAAQLVRRYRAARDGRLAELPADDDTGVSPPPDAGEVESYAGEDAAVLAHLGPNAVILDHRAPSLFEELVGLSAIIHASRHDGAEVGCGVGWHGGTAFVLVAAFPRHGQDLAPPPELEAAVEKAVRTRNLIRHETRLDEQGFCVIARERGRQSLVAIRLVGKATRIDPHVPGRDAAMNDDQRRWLAYAETYEARTILDTWRNGDSDEIAVLTIDPEHEAWRHAIDADGIELSRQPDNAAAAAVLYRERLAPPDDASGLAVEAMEGTREPAFAAAVTAQYEAADPNSLLTKALAWSRVVSVLTEVAAAAGSGASDHAVLECLDALLEPLTALPARFSAASLRHLIAQAPPPAEGLTGALHALITRLRDEMALTLVVLLPPGHRPADADPSFGPLVEQHFPAAAYDIEEMAHCLALRRSTAAVLHAMQAMRHGLLGLERLLSTAGLPDLSWTRLIAIVRDARGDFNDVVVALGRVRRAWRAPGLPPAAKYTEEEAETVLAAVEALMRAVAARLEAADDMVKL